MVVPAGAKGVCSVRMKIFFSACFGALGAGLLFAGSAGCDAGKQQTVTGGSAGTGSAGSSGTAGSAAGGSIGSAGTDPFTGSGGGGSGVSCGDLHSVIDAEGNLVKTCPPELGCYNGECIPACEAAALRKENVGCDFVVATPANATPGCFSVFVANNWNKPVQIHVERAGAVLDATKFARIPNGNNDPSTWAALAADGLPPDQVAVVFLSGDDVNQALKCPSQAVAGTSTLTTSGVGDAFRVTTDVPVSAYDIFPFGGAKSYVPGATLLLPTTAWGDNYVTANPPMGMCPAIWGQVVAAADDTHVTIVPTTDLPAAGPVNQGFKNQVTTFTLGAGQFVQWSGIGDMAGSVISSDKPIVYNGGNSCLALLSKTTASSTYDEAHQQIPPVRALGSDYIVAPYTTRMSSLMPESIPYRIVGVVDGTTLTYDPPVDGAPATLALGQTVDFESTIAFRVTSDADHPFYVGQSMTGGGLVGGSRPDGAGAGLEWLGDPEYVNVLPAAQYLSTYLFYTDVTYTTTNLVLTRVKKDGAFKDVTVDCLGTITGWAPVGAGGEFEVTTVDLLRIGQSINGCTNGAHTAKSEAPFGVTVWGTDHAASYAYPAGGSVTAINKVVIIPEPK